jgi:hypothetical protein
MTVGTPFWRFLFEVHFHPVFPPPTFLCSIFGSYIGAPVELLKVPLLEAALEAALEALIEAPLLEVPPLEALLAALLEAPLEALLELLPALGTNPKWVF